MYIHIELSVNIMVLVNKIELFGAYMHLTLCATITLVAVIPRDLEWWSVVFLGRLTHYMYPLSRGPSVY